MRSVSAGVAGVVLTGLIATTSTSAHAQTDVDAHADQKTGQIPTLAVFQAKDQTLLSTLGAPKFIVTSDKFEKEDAKKALAAQSKQLEKEAKRAAEQAEADRIAAEQAAAEQAEADRIAAEQAALTTQNSVVESTPATSQLQVQSLDVTPVGVHVSTQSDTGADSIFAPGWQTPAPDWQSPAPVTNTPPAPSGSSHSASRDAVVNAARAAAAVNAQTDCTVLASNALAAAGINFHGWPADYQSLGTIVGADQAQPGDLIYYASNGFGQSHIAVYLGNGMAVHGGWNGMGTSVFSAYLPSASAPIFISPSAF